MIETVFIFLILFFSIFLDISVGSFGLTIPFLACSIFYISVVYGFKIGFIISLLAGILIDSLLGRSYLISPFAFTVVSIFASYWLRNGVLKLIGLQAIPGGIVALLYFGPLLLTNYFVYDSGFFLFLFKNLYLILSIAFGMLLMPILIILLDTFSDKLGLSLYVKAQKKLHEKT